MSTAPAINNPDEAEVSVDIEHAPERVESQEGAPDTEESVVGFGSEISRIAAAEVSEAIDSGVESIEGVVESVDGTSEDLKEGKAAIEGVQQEMTNLLTETQERIDSLTEQLVSVETDKEKREQLALKCNEVVKKIVEWADEYGIDISRMKKLGGGFVNLVLLIESPDGRGYVAKAFLEDDQAEVTREAQKEFDRLSDADEDFIPEVIAWIDDKTVVTKKADGKPIRKLLEAAAESPEQQAEAIRAFYDLAGTLASIHERTENPFVRSEQGKDDEKYRINAEKFIRHLKTHAESGLFDLSDEQLEKLESTIKEITDGGFISLIHGDAHLDQFFKAPDKSILAIVDYDSIHYGDPMADVARSLSSIRDWGRKMEVPPSVLEEVEKSFMDGYRNKRIEDHSSEELEFDQAKILAYEARLNMVQLKHYDGVREKIKASLPSGETELDFYKSHENGEAIDIDSGDFSEDDVSAIKELMAIRKNAGEIVKYLQSMGV